jgi:hypothetical protein
MISLPQLEANRRNALRSTGPKTDEGKRHSRLNAVRHGLTCETVVGSLEDAEDYKAFEAAIIADYRAETAVARELVLRLASLLWRLRRATAIETDLLELEAEGLAGHAPEALNPNRCLEDQVVRRIENHERPVLIHMASTGASQEMLVETDVNLTSLLKMMLISRRQPGDLPTPFCEQLGSTAPFSSA